MKKKLIGFMALCLIMGSSSYVLGNNNNTVDIELTQEDESKFIEHILIEEAEKNKFVEYISIEEAKELGLRIVDINEIDNFVDDESRININRTFSLTNSRWTTIGSSSTGTWGGHDIFLTNSVVNNGNVRFEVRNAANQLLGFNYNVPPRGGIRVSIPRNTSYTVYASSVSGSGNYVIIANII